MLGEPNHRAEKNGRFRSYPADNACGLPEDAFEGVLAEQSRSWATGKRILAGQWIQQYPALAADLAQGAELVYHELVLRQELGESPDWDEYLREFPQHAACLWQLRRADDLVWQVFTQGEDERQC